MNDNGFNTACPSGNHMIDVKEPEEKDPNDYPDLQEEQDREG